LRIKEFCVPEWLASRQFQSYRGVDKFKESRRSLSGAPTQALSLSSNLSEIALAPDSPVLEQVLISILGFSSETVTVGYKTIPGNHPEENGNTLTLWEGTVIDWKHPELGTTVKVENNDTNGSYSISGVDISRKTYIVGYSVTGEVMGICASALVEAGELMLAPTSVTLEIGSMAPGELAIDYATLRGYKPLSAKNWLGLWPGDINPYDGDPPVETRYPPDDINAGTVTFTSTLRPKFTYTVGYFMADQHISTSYNSVAALLRFDTA